jgi:glutamyl-tRNA reductase
MRLAITHCAPGNAAIPPGTAVWRTCLREVRFSNDVRDTSGASVGVELADADAYRLLLEILCGLQSPMLGETQVMGQFKAFLSSLDGTHAWLTRLGQRLLADARDIRTRHLQGLGSRSYGSAVRRHLSGCSHAALIGTGKLAQEVLPFLAGDGRAVDQWGRRDDATSTLDGVIYRTLDAVDSSSASTMVTLLVIAAPAASDLVNRVIRRYPSLTQVIDLRGEPDRTPLDTRARVVTLQDLFAQMTEANAFAARHVEAANADIASCSRRYEMRDELRPFGWDDLCA